MANIEQVKREYPNLHITDLAGGWNVHLSDGSIITIWFKKRKMKSNKQKTWTIFSDTQDLFNLISYQGNKKLKERRTVTVIEPEPGINKVQLCINHVNEKARRMCEVKGITNSTVMMLQTVALELEQYL